MVGVVHDGGGGKGEGFGESREPFILIVVDIVPVKDSVVDMGCWESLCPC